jgi:hypothetical protein
MNFSYNGFGRIEVDGNLYTEDILLEEGTVRLREKKPSRDLKRHYGHTPLSDREPIPWNCRTLIVGTDAYGKLPITEEVYAAASEREVKLVAAPTEEACRLLSQADLGETNAILHLTC